MARIIGKIKAQYQTGAVIREDSRGMENVNVVDADTNQHIKIYPKKDMPLLFTEKKLSSTKKYTFIGTIHPFVNDKAKMICTQVKVAR